MPEPMAGTKLVGSQNWLRKGGTHRDQGICCALVLVWVQEILQGRGQWAAQLAEHGEQAANPALNPTTRWTPPLRDQDREGSLIGTYMGGHIASRIYDELKANRGSEQYERAMHAAYQKRRMNIEYDQTDDLEPIDALRSIAGSDQPRVFQLDMFDHTVGVYFSPPSVLYFDPNYGVYRFDTIVDFRAAVGRHLIDCGYCDPTHRDQRRREIALTPISVD